MSTEQEKKNNFLSKGIEPSFCVYHAAIISLYYVERMFSFRLITEEEHCGYNKNLIILSIFSQGYSFLSFSCVMYSLSLRKSQWHVYKHMRMIKISSFALKTLWMGRKTNHRRKKTYRERLILFIESHSFFSLIKRPLFFLSSFLLFFNSETSIMATRNLNHHSWEGIEEKGMLIFVNNMSNMSYFYSK